MSRWQRFLDDSSFLREYLWKYRGYVALGLLALVIVDVLEVLPPVFLKRAIDIATEGGPVDGIARLAAAYLGVSLVQGVGRYSWRIFLIRASLFAGRDLRNRYAQHLFGLSASFYDRKPVGDLMSLATSDVEAVRMMIGGGLLTLADALFYFATVPVAMYLLSPKLTLIAFLPLPVIPWLVMRNQTAIHERFEKVQESFGTISALAQESLNGIRVSKAFAKEDALTSRFKKAGEEYIRLNLRLARVQTAFGPTLDFAMSLGLVLLLYIGGRDLLGPSPTLTLGTFVAFQRYIQKMIWPMAALGMALSSYQRSVTSSSRLKEVFAHKPDVPEASEPELPEKFPGRINPAQLPGWKTAGAIEFRDLSFGFSNSSEKVLKKISLRIEPGERVAFVGAIGAGKSALLSLLPRLYPIESGMLFIDGVDVNRWPLEELRRQVGYVSQDLFLFSETVVENIAYGLAGWVEREGEVSSIEEATQLACVHEDVIGLTGSYRTRVGERGVNLSGGQKQRLTIARAIVKKPSILVLDDALSSVDVQTEERILKGLRSRGGRNTEIIAAHRISTIQDADRIVLLENGAIRQMGRHADLMQDRRGLYRKFFEQQQLQADLELYSERLDEEILQPSQERVLE